MKTGKGIFEPSQLEHLNEIFDKYVKGKKFLDLGSGVGHVVKFALDYTSTATGVEHERSLFYCTHTPENILHEDFLNHDLSQYDVLYYYIYGTDDEKALVEKIKKSFKGVFIVYHGILSPDDKRDEDGHLIPNADGRYTSDEREFYNLLDFTLLEEFPYGKVYQI